MKVKVKTTGEIVEVDLPYISMSNEIIYPEIGSTCYYTQDELDFDIEKENIIIYWTRLEHQYAGMAMQGLMSKEYLDNPDSLVSHAIHYAHALVEKLKNSNIKKEQ